MTGLDDVLPCCADINHNLLHDLKEMAIDLQNVKQRMDAVVNTLNILSLENVKLRVIVEDVCQRASNE